MAGLFSQRLQTSWKAARQLGIHQAGLYAIYSLAQRSGYLSLRLKPGRYEDFPVLPIQTHLLKLPDPQRLAELLAAEGQQRLLQEAGEIMSGSVRLFGADPAPMALGNQPVSSEDIKLTWEMGRFGWAFVLGRAFWLSGSEPYAASFWDYAETFFAANPPNAGIHWESAQEVALRLISLVFAGQLFAGSRHSTPQRMLRLGQVIAAHASRIPPTLVYARAQHNNHLISEAAGLLTAAFALPQHPRAPGWKKAGWRWLNAAFHSQIDADGAYVQHSTNYHRLALQAALWAWALAGYQGLAYPPETCHKLKAASDWLQSLLDPESGQAPNLGPNDGAYILPLDTCGFADYRPTLQAANRAFGKQVSYPPGPWDELGLWLGLEPNQHESPYQAPSRSGTPHVLHARHSWAYLRLANFRSRPGHADQLHLDLWWRGLNIARDAGTYLYNSTPPWENALAHTAVHNTLTLDNQDQMTWAGRFLWLDWAQAQVIDYQKKPGSEKLVARQEGYRRRGYIHQREVVANRGESWQIVDRLLPSGSMRQPASNHSACLHWLLPDWPWKLDRLPGGARLQIQSPYGWIILSVSASELEPADIQRVRIELVRAGQFLHGQGQPLPARGWISPTYAQKIPALSLALYAPPLAIFTSQWSFPQDSNDE